MFGLSAWTLAAQPSRPPNIVFFLADDLGQRDLGSYGSSFYDTPHLDRLAREGARFTQAYAASPVCSPTRASVQTGQWPARTGITDYIGAAQPGQWQRNTRHLPAPYDTRLPLEATTIAEVLKTAGYATLHAGKWHLGPEGFWPEDQGYEINRGGIDRGGPYGGNKYFSPYDNPRLTDGPEGEHLPDRLAEECVRFIQTHRDRPFFVSYCFYDVHTPLMGRSDLVKKYEARRAGLEEPVDRWGQEGARRVRLNQSHATYGAMVEAMDAAVGKVLSALDELGLAENTLVVFTSDNGGFSTGDRAPTANTPLRAGKGWLYEGGIREPLIVRWPGVTNPGSVIDPPVSTLDLFPTFAGAAGAARPDGLIVDGQSLRPMLQGEPVPERPLFWHYPHYGNQGGAPGAAIRLGDWKLIEWAEGPRVELFNLREDPSEILDLAVREPARTELLLALLHAWQREIGARFSRPNPAYRSVARE